MLQEYRPHTRIKAPSLNTWDSSWNISSQEMIKTFYSSKSSMTNLKFVPKSGGWTVALIVVNFLILGSQEVFASHNTNGLAVMDTLCMSDEFAFAMLFPRGGMRNFIPGEGRRKHSAGLVGDGEGQLPGCGARPIMFLHEAPQLTGLVQFRRFFQHMRQISASHQAHDGVSEPPVWIQDSFGVKIVSPLQGLIQRDLPVEASKTASLQQSLQRVEVKHLSLHRPQGFRNEPVGPETALQLFIYCSC